MLIVAPYYNRPTQEGLFRHFARIAEVTDRPIVLYSIPSRCGVEIGVPVVERLRAKFPHVCYIKEAGGTVDRVDQLKMALGDDLVVLSGDDSLTIPFMAVGAEGVISWPPISCPGSWSSSPTLPLPAIFAPPPGFTAGSIRCSRRCSSRRIRPPSKRRLRMRVASVSPEVRLPLCEISEASSAALKRAMALSTR